MAAKTGTEGEVMAEGVEKRGAAGGTGNAGQVRVEEVEGEAAGGEGRNGRGKVGST
jgi:hypothetical protein